MQMENAVSFTFSAAMTGTRRSLPLFFGVILFGLVIGVTARQTGLNLGETALMSSTVFARAAQFVALSLWQESLPVLTIVFTTLLENLLLAMAAETGVVFLARNFFI